MNAGGSSPKPKGPEWGLNSRHSADAGVESARGEPSGSHQLGDVPAVAFATAVLRVPHCPPDLPLSLGDDAHGLSQFCLRGPGVSRVADRWTGSKRVSGQPGHDPISQRRPKPPSRAVHTWREVRAWEAKGGSGVQRREMAAQNSHPPGEGDVLGAWESPPDPQGTH